MVKIVAGKPDARKTPAEAVPIDAGTVLESMGDAFYALDRNWRFGYVNRQAERLWQQRREE